MWLSIWTQDMLRILCASHSTEKFMNLKTWPYFTFNLCMTRTKKRMCVNIVISGFCLDVNEIFTVLGGYISYISSLLLTFWGDLSAPSSVVKSSMSYLYQQLLWNKYNFFEWYFKEHVCVCAFIHCSGVHGSLHNEHCVPRHSTSKKLVAFAMNSCLCCDLYICGRFVNSIRVMKCVVWNLACQLIVRCRMNSR